MSQASRNPNVIAGTTESATDFSDRERRRLFARVVGFWLTVGLTIVGVDLLLFDTGYFWLVRPEFNEASIPETLNWGFVFETARTIETDRRPVPMKVVVIGSSVLRYGLDAARVNEALRARHLPIEVVPLISLGSTATDSALVAWQARVLNPWLVIYAASMRDFFMGGITDSAVKRVFYDSTATLPLWPRNTMDARIAAFLQTHWKLYRYRIFARRDLIMALDAILAGATGPRPAAAGEVAPESVPTEAYRYFAPIFIDRHGWDAWLKWRASGRFEDYEQFILARNGKLALSQYRAQTRETCRLNGNPHVAAFAWMLARLETAGLPSTIVYFPENPAFSVPEAAQYFDPQLSQAYADYFAKTAGEHHGRFEDWRNLLPADDYYDMIHVNLAGTSDLVPAFVQLVEAEWKRRQP